MGKTYNKAFIKRVVEKEERGVMSCSPLETFKNAASG